MTDDQISTAAAAFATALDREDYKAARALMAGACSYLFRKDTIEGADKIIASYQSNGDAARKKYEEVLYESAVEVTGERSATLHYTDIVNHRGHQLIHRCRQHIEFDNAGLVSSITHEDLEGEAESLAAFKAKWE